MVLLLQGITAGIALSQVLTESTAGIPLSSIDTKTTQVPANTAATFLDMTVDTPTAGDTLGVICGNASITITLIQPNAVEVTAANAASLGYTWTVRTALASLPGVQILIGLPASAAAGIYRVKANSLGIQSASVMNVAYSSKSAVRAGLTTGARTYRLGEAIVLTAPVYSGTTPVTGASGTAKISLRRDVSSQVSIGNYRLISTTAVDATTSDYVYAADLTNGGPSLAHGMAEVQSNSPDTLVMERSVSFPSAGSGATVASIDDFTLRRNNSTPFQPAVLTWRVVTQDAPVSVSLTDSGAYDAAPNDGLYTGSFTPSVAGDYAAVAEITGVSGGTAFSRSASTQVTVITPQATLVGFQDQAMDDNGNGLTDRLVTTVTISVQQAGEYSLFMLLKGSNGKMLSTGAKLTLVPGQHQVPLTFRAKEILTDIGVNGPYQRSRVQLTRVDSTTQSLADGRADAGLTAPYPLSSFDRGRIYLTGQTSASGVVTTSGPLFDVFRVQIGVYTPGGPCSWHGMLTQPTKLPDGMIQMLNVFGNLPAGNATITLDFAGTQISGKGTQGAYEVSSVGLSCGSDRVTSAGPVWQGNITPSQFITAPSDFTLAVSPAPVSFAAGTSGRGRVTVAVSGAFESPVALSVSGLPAGMQAHFPISETLGRGVVPVYLQAASSVAPGSYPATVIGKSGALTRSAPLTVVVTAPPTYSVGAQPVGPVFFVDGVRYESGQAFAWLPGSVHQLEVQTPQGPGGQSRYTFLNWSDGQPATHNVTVPASPTHYVAQFAVEHRLNTRTNLPAGTITPADGSWHAQSTQLTLQATPNPGFHFLSWSGPVSSITSASTTVTMDSYRNVTANFGINGDVTATTQITTSGFLYSRVTKTFNGTMTVKNVGSTSLTGPLHVWFENLALGVTLANASGSLLERPYISTAGPLAPGTTVSIPVSFLNPNNAVITAKTRVIQGTLP